LEEKGGKEFTLFLIPGPEKQKSRQRGDGARLKADCGDMA